MTDPKFCLRQYDDLLLEQLLCIYKDNVIKNVGHCCIEITSFAVLIAKRAADNLHEILVSLSDLVILRGHENDFDIEHKYPTIDRILDMSISVAKMIITGDKIITDIQRNTNIVKTYYHNLKTLDQNTVDTFRTFISHNNLTISEAITRKPKVFCGC
jgi:hypothetical protein